MGMSASQARFLMLTAQKNNNEFQAQRICFERLSLSQQTEQATVEYNDKINARMLLFQGHDENGKIESEIQLTYAHITEQPPNGLGMKLVSAIGGKEVVAKYPDGITEEEKGNYFVDPELLNANLLEKNLREGNYIIRKPSSETEDGYENYSIDASPFIVDAYRKMDFPQAEGEYNVKKEQFHNADKKLELKLKQLESEHKAIETEMESVKKVVDKNVETTFKTFG